MAIDLATSTRATVFLAAALCAIVALAAATAVRRTGNGAIGLVSAGFLLMAAKNGVKAWHLGQGPEGLAWEAAFSLVDLCAVALVALPILRGWWRRRG